MCQSLGITITMTLTLLRSPGVTGDKNRCHILFHNKYQTLFILDMTLSDNNVVKSVCDIKSNRI